MGASGITRPDRPVDRGRLPMRERLVILCKLGSGKCACVAVRGVFYCHHYFLRTCAVVRCLVLEVYRLGSTIPKTSESCAFRSRPPLTTLPCIPHCWVVCISDNLFIVCVRARELQASHLLTLSFHIRCIECCLQGIRFARHAIGRIEDDSSV